MNRAKEIIDKLVIAIEKSTISDKERLKAIKATLLAERIILIGKAMILSLQLCEQSNSYEKRAFKKELQATKKQIKTITSTLSEIRDKAIKNYIAGGFTPEKGSVSDGENIKSYILQSDEPIINLRNTEAFRERFIKGN